MGKDDQTSEEARGTKGEASGMSNVKLTKLDCSFGGDKRQNLPYRIEWVCPKCGYCWEDDYANESYLSYSEIGAVNQVALECQNWEDSCYKKITIYLRIELTAEIV
jgi:hypothetical protein